MTDLVPFDNGEFHLNIRLHEADGFRVQAPGLARSLGFREAYDLLRVIPEVEKGSEIVRTPGGDQRIGYLTEAGFYRALGQRQSARISDPDIRNRVARFQTWVFGEVLPSIRKTGSYGNPAEVETLTPLEYAKRLVAAEERAVEAHERAEEAEQFKRSIEAGEGLALTDFHKKYFSLVPHTKFFDHLYAKGYLIDQRGKGSERDDGTFRDGPQHRKPGWRGKPFFYLHGGKDKAGTRRENTRVRPGSWELALREELAKDGLPANETAFELFAIDGGQIRGELS